MITALGSNGSVVTPDSFDNTNTQDEAGFVLIVTGPSGCGKSSLIRMLIETSGIGDFHFSVSLTTRSPRTGEVHGKDYCFVTQEEFDTHLKSGRFLEYKKVGDYHYGTPRDSVFTALSKDLIVIVDADVHGAIELRERLKEANKMFMDVIVMPPSVTDLEMRLRARGTEDDAQIKRRLSRAEEEMSFHKLFNHRLLNYDLSTCFSHFLSELCLFRQVQSGRLNTAV